MFSQCQIEIAKLREQELAAERRPVPARPRKSRRVPKTRALVAGLLVLSALAAAPLVGTARADDYAGEAPEVDPKSPLPALVWQDDDDRFVALEPSPLLLDPLGLAGFRGPWMPPGYAG